MKKAKKAKIAVVGGGIAGSTIALYLSELGLDITLFEKGPSLVNGPPICHLHAGGNLYREISDEQCITLLKESIDLLKFYPEAVDYRPTVIAVPLDDEGKPENLYRRLQRLKQEYATLIKEDSSNEVLGRSSEYFKLYERKDLETLQKRKAVKQPSHADEWMVAVAKHLDLQKLQFPLILVQEYGLNLFRLASMASLTLQKKQNCKVLLNHKVSNLQKNCGSDTWCVAYTFKEKSEIESFDFLINAAGFRTGNLDDMLGYKRERFVEFKAAYVSQWENDETWPEVVFFGERGTPKGMAQFTPYPGGYFQLHGMTKSITLFDEGLVKSSEKSAQPELDTKFLDKIEKRWKGEDAKQRGKLAVDYLSSYIPEFEGAKVCAKPLFGAQQIPGNDDSLRASNVSFEDEFYARCEIVKASSVLSMADMITQQLFHLGYVEEKMLGKRNFKTMKTLTDQEITKYAESLCEERNYPSCLAHTVVSS